MKGQETLEEMILQLIAANKRLRAATHQSEECYQAQNDVREITQKLDLHMKVKTVAAVRKRGRPNKGK